MKHFILCMFIQLIFTISSGSSADIKLFSSSPIGRYRLVFKQAYNCNLPQNNKMQFNVYLSHQKNKTMLFGNSSSAIPFDDTLFGAYISPGMDLQSLFEHSNFPKFFIYMEHTNLKFTIHEKMKFLAAKLSLLI